MTAIDRAAQGGMNGGDVTPWRKAERDRLIAARENLDAATLALLRQRIDAHLGRSFPGLAAATLAFCWPIRGEYDARRLAQRRRECGAVTALPVVVTPRPPLVFREWHPGVPLASGPLGIPYPVDSDRVVPTAMLVPMNGWDEAGYRLGYGGGFFRCWRAQHVQQSAGGAKATAKAERVENPRAATPPRERRQETAPPPARSQRQESVRPPAAPRHDPQPNAPREQAAPQQAPRRERPQESTQPPTVPRHEPPPNASRDQASPRQAPRGERPPADRPAQPPAVQQRPAQHPAKEDRQQDRGPDGRSEEGPSRGRK